MNATTNTPSDMSTEPQFSHWKRRITLFLISQTISLFGSSIVQYAIIWHITLTTSSGVMLMGSTLCGFLPQIAISLFAGVWVDTFPRKTLILLADGCIALSTLGLAVLFLCGETDTGWLFAALVVRSAGTGIQTPAVNAVIPQLVPRSQLMRVNSINSTLASLMQFLAPAVSGIILTLTSIETTFMLDVGTAVLGMGILATLAIPAATGTVGDSTLKTIAQGFTYVQSSAFIKNILIYQLVVLVLISPSAFLTPLMVSRSFGPEVWRLTVGEMTYSAGAVIGGLLLAAWGGFRNRAHTLFLAGAGYGMLMVCMGMAPDFIVYMLFNTLIGLTAPCYSASLNVLIQENVPSELLGRAFSFVQLAGSCAFPAGMLLFGPLADIFQVNHLLAGCGVAVVLSTLCNFLRWNKHIGQLQS